MSEQGDSALTTIGVSGAQAPSPDLGPEAHIEAGIVRGVPRDDHGVLAFKDIPYAAPPVGDLRCRATSSSAPMDAPYLPDIRDVFERVPGLYSDDKADGEALRLG